MDVKRYWIDRDLPALGMRRHVFDSARLGLPYTPAKRP